MKVAFSNIAWPPEEQATVAAAMVREGIGGVELAPTMVWPDPTAVRKGEAQEQRRWWADRGIQVVAMQALLYGRPHLTIFETTEQRRQTLAYLKSIFRLAAWLGASRLVFGSPRNRRVGELPSEERDRIARDFFGEAGAAAAGFGVMMCIEPNPADYGCDYINRVGEARALVAVVDSPGFGLHLDTGGMTLEGETGDVIGAGPPDHFHISEPYLAVVGSGDTDHRGFAEALRGVAYDGWCSIEMRKPETESRIEDLTGVMRFAVAAYGS